MFKIKFGVWQQVMAKEVMLKAWKIVKKTKCSLSEGLKKSWEEVKSLFSGISASFKDFKQKLSAKLSMKNSNKYKTIDNNMIHLIDKGLENMRRLKKGKGCNRLVNWFSKIKISDKNVIKSDIWINTGHYGIVMRKL